jgi:hypothetical protein
MWRRGRRALPFADASFDVVWIKYLLQCLQEKPIISHNRSASELFSKSVLRARRGHPEPSKWKRPCHYRKSNSDVLMVQTCRSRKIPSSRRRDRRRDCPDFQLRVSTLYASYYDESRSHLSLRKDTPRGRAVQRYGNIAATPVMSGLHHRYMRI